MRFILSQAFDNFELQMKERINLVKNNEKYKNSFKMMLNNSVKELAALTMIRFLETGNFHGLMTLEQCLDNYEELRKEKFFGVEKDSECSVEEFTDQDIYDLMVLPIPDLVIPIRLEYEYRKLKHPLGIELGIISDFTTIGEERKN